MKTLHNHGIADPGYCPSVPIQITARKQLSYREQILIGALKKVKNELPVSSPGTQFVDYVVGLFEE